MNSNRADFLRVLGDLRGGLVATDAGQKLEEIIKAIRTSGTKGELTIKLTLKPVGSQNKEIHVSAQVTHKKPNNPDIEERTTFFADDRGQLHRDDPAQNKLPLGPSGVANGGSPAENGEDEDRRYGTYG